MNILLALLFILVPAPIIWLSNRVKIVEKIGVVIICYALGMLVGNLGVLPESFSAIQSAIQDISICLALPLILFSIDVRKWTKIAKKGLVCMGLAVVSIATVVFVLHMAFVKSNPDVADYGALAIGVYTGGTINIAAIAAARNIPENTYVMFNTVDMVISALYMVFLTSIGRKFFQKVFRLRKFEGDMNAGPIEDVSNDSSYKGMAKPAILGKLVLAFLLSAVIVGISYVAGTFVKGYETAVTILLITTLAIACSFIKPVREIKKTTPLGMYIIYIFCFAVATMADFSEIARFDYTIIIYVTVAIFGSMFLHALLCKFAKIDSDTMIVTSVSAICSPPFVPVVTAALNNNAVLVSGLTTGIIGYAIGNYFGIFTHIILEKLPF